MSDTAKLAAAAVPVIVASIALASLLRGWYRRTIGRRRDLERRLQRLGTCVQRSYFEEILEGAPTFRRRVISKLMAEVTECTWVDRNFYLHAIVDSDDEVMAFYVVSRSRRFRPRFCSPAGSGYRHERRIPFGLHRLLGDPMSALSLRGRIKWRIVPLYDVRLGKTRLADACPKSSPGRIYSAVGARLGMYADYYEFGNPGAFQTFVIGLNSAGWLRAPAIPRFDHGEEDFEDWGLLIDGIDGGESELLTFRRQARANVFGVMAPHLFDDLWAAGGHTPGPHVERVRTIL